MTRREVIGLLGACATGSANFDALAQPKLAAPRMPLEEFVQNDELLKALRKGVREMKKRKPSDPRSWFFQAAIHGVTGAAVDEATNQDPTIRRSCWTRYWNQCPHFGENSANFLPWHRAYTYHFEKILRAHAENDNFSLPYWNYTDPKRPENRKFPKEFGIEHLDGNLGNEAEENINPLFHPERDFYFCGYEHPFAAGLPLLALTESAVDISLPMAAPVFFGQTEREGLGGGIADEDGSTRGLLESYPHDHIHRAVGGIIEKVIDGQRVPTVGAMATPPTAGFDPVFPVHHSNIDRLWAVWACMPGKQWGKLPPPTWFDERAWTFFDTDGKEVNEPRRAYFDYRAMGIRFKYEDANCKPLALPGADKLKVEAVAARVQRLERLATHKAPVTAFPAPVAAVVPVPGEVVEKLQAPAKAVRAAVAEKRDDQRVVLRLSDVRLGMVQSTGFDVYLTDKPKGEFRRSNSGFVGSVAMFRHEGHSVHNAGAHGHSARPQDESFDVTKAIAALGNEKLEGLSLVLVPYSLLTVPGQSTTILNSREVLRVGGVEFFRMELK